MATATEARQTTVEAMREEAVFISGPRRGQIVSVPHGGFAMENGENTLTLTDEQAAALEILANELTQAASTLGEVVSQVERLNSKMKTINRRLSDPIENLTQAVTAAITINQQLQQLKDRLTEVESDMNQMGEHITDLRVRVAVLEQARENDRAQMAAEFERFALRMERMAIRPQLPPETNDN